MAVDRVLGNDSFVILILPEWATIDATGTVDLSSNGASVRLRGGGVYRLAASSSRCWR